VTVRVRAWSWLAMLMVLAVFAVGARADAQVNPHGIVRTLRTQHFRVHYPVALDSLARRAAAEAEFAWANLATELAPPAGPVDLLLQDNVDASNGFATTFPTNRITIYVVPPVALAELRFHDDWLRLVVTHELTHIFHLDRARGLWRVGRDVFGRNPALFPNQLLPSWIQEGTAVHYESKFTGSGRIVSTESRVVASAAARDNNVLSPDAWSLSTTRFPGGQMAYAWGSMLMHREAERSDSAMRKFVDYTATFPIPFLLDRAAKRGFGETFTKRFNELRDSLIAAQQGSSSADARWIALPTLDTLGMRYAAYPRWRDSSTIEWVASNGRDITGLFRGVSPTSAAPTVAPRRVARRNSLDVSAPVGRDGAVYSQVEYFDAYTLRSDLYVHDSTGDRRLTHDARLIYPDVRPSDGAIVAVQLIPGSTRIVRVSATGAVAAITTGGGAEWAEPRWSRAGNHIAAVQLLPNGVQRIVMLDTLGALVSVITETRAVVATPAFSPTSPSILMWTSDRSGRMQIETINSLHMYQADTLWRGNVRSILNVSTGVYHPSFAPNGSNDIAALVYRTNGFVVSVAKFDTTNGYAVVDTGWYSSHRFVPDTVTTFNGASSSYHALRQLVPRYWQPEIGQARDGGVTFGAYTSSSDILQRHSYTASAELNPRNGETDGALAYSYAGFGMPVVSAYASQNWDVTLRSVDTTGALLGVVGRRIQSAGLSFGWFVPHVRWSTSYAVGAGYEARHFASETDAALGAPNSPLRTGTRYPSLFASGGISTLARAGEAFSAEQGVAAAGSVSLRKREGASNTNSLRTIGVLRAFQPLSLPGFARHVLAARIAGGFTDSNASSALSVGGVSGIQTELVPGVSFGDPSRTFPVRGFAPGAEYGTRSLSATAEYRAPLTLVARGAGLFPLFLDKLSVDVFGDAARAWCPSTLALSSGLCSGVGTRDGWLASVGGELAIDLALQYDVPYRLRLGFARPVASPALISRKSSLFVTLGAYF
jgi:hypothetical protein